MRKLSLRPWYVLMATVLAIPITASSTEIYGTVLDPGGLPVSGARVAAGGLVAWSGADGGFRIPDVPAGARSVVGHFPEFEAIELQVDVPPSGSVRLDIRFREVRESFTAVEVVADAAEALAEIPGSVAAIRREELDLSKPVEANEVLRRVPGLIVRADSGPASMRLNIGVRGLNPDRSRNVLMLEDGIPITLAPYGEPEMYYSPPIDRMRRVEVLKGSGQIVHGPQTVGGVINFVTPEPPTATHGSVNIDGGQFGYFAANANIGGSTRGQKVGWFTNFLQKRGDGWRDFWFDITDAQGKLTLKPNGVHTIGLKFGFYDEESNSTYLGLTGPQWERNPGANSAPHDLLVVRRYSGSMVHTAALSPDVVWSNTFYAYNTLRNWSRQDFHRADLGRDYLGVDGDPSIPGGAVFLRNSTGNNNRQFSVAGAQTALSVFHSLGPWRAKLDTGLRYVHESASDKRINGDTFDARTGVLRDGENRYGNAGSGFIQERIYLGDRVILTPGFRFEYYDYQRDIYLRGFEDVDRFARHRVREAIPGLGVSVKAHEMFTLFAGVHRGFSPPRTKDAITSSGVPLDLDAEFSWNYEAGLRFQRPRVVSGEVVFFRLDFENQIIPGAQSGGATTTLVNAGETLHQGMEASVRTHWNEIVPLSWLVYTDFRYMYLPTAEFVRNALYGGNRLPYAPENTFSVLLGLRQRQGFGLQVDASYMGRQYGDNANLEQPANDGTAGPLPSYIVWNAMAEYSVRRERFEVTPYFTVKNLADARYIASRAPQGIQPGFFRQAIAGLRFTF